MYDSADDWQLEGHRFANTIWHFSNLWRIEIMVIF